MDDAGVIMDIWTAKTRHKISQKNLVENNIVIDIGVRHKTLNIDKAKEVLNWIPKVSLKDGMQRTVDWDRENI